MATVFSSSLIPPNRSFCVNRTCLRDWLNYHPSFSSLSGLPSSHPHLSRSNRFTAPTSPPPVISDASAGRHGATTLKVRGEPS